MPSDAGSDARPAFGMNEAAFRDALTPTGRWRAYVRGRPSERLLYLASVRLGFARWADRLRPRVWAPCGEPDLDDRGNIRSLAPGHYAEALLWDEPGRRLAARWFLCRYDGDGELHFTGDLKVVRRRPGELIVGLRRGAGQTVARVTRTNPQNPLRNIRLWPDGCEVVSLPSPNGVRRYHLFVPRGYDGREAAPLMAFISPDGEPLEWDCWRQICERAGALYCAPVGAGNDCPVGLRTRIVLDMLDDVRRRYRVDPDQTYLAGFSGGGRMACRIAFALPDQFGAVVPICGAEPPPEPAPLRQRIKGRLSVALVTGQADVSRKENEAVLAPQFADLGVRSKLWVVPRLAHDMPPADVLADVYAWLAADRARRRARRATPPPFLSYD